MQGTVTAGSSMPMGEGAEGQLVLVAGVRRLWEGTHNWQGFPNTFPPESSSQQAAPQHPQSPNMSPLSPLAAKPRARAQQSPEPESITFPGESTKSGKAGVLPGPGAGPGEGGWRHPSWQGPSSHEACARAEVGGHSPELKKGKRGAQGIAASTPGLPGMLLPSQEGCPALPPTRPGTCQHWGPR